MNIYSIVMDSVGIFFLLLASQISVAISSGIETSQIVEKVCTYKLLQYVLLRRSAIMRRMCPPKGPVVTITF